MTYNFLSRGTTSAFLRASLFGEYRMRRWQLPAALILAAACSNNDGGSGPGTTPDAPQTLSSVSLDGAIALTWSDNAYIADPSNFQNYRVYSTTYNIDANPPTCGRCLPPRRHDGGPGIRGRCPDQRGAALLRRVRRSASMALRATGLRCGRYAAARCAQCRRSSLGRPRPRGSGFRFWDDLNGDGQVQSGELGLVQGRHVGAIDFCGRPRRDGRSLSHPRSRRHRRGVLRRYDAGRGSHEHRFRGRPDLSHHADSKRFPASATSSR